MIQWIIIGLWLVLLTFWLIAATTAKRTIGNRRWSRWVAVRIAIFALIFFAMRDPGTRHAIRAMEVSTASNTVLGLIGLAICVSGVALAIAARVYLGRNWGMPGTQKESPELITSGPYTVIRHPIYTGFLLVTLGSAIGISPIWFLVFVICAFYFVVSARREERIMLERFPDAYPAYVKRTKMLLPFIV